MKTEDQEQESKSPSEINVNGLYLFTEDGWQSKHKHIVIGCRGDYEQIWLYHDDIDGVIEALTKLKEFL